MQRAIQRELNLPQLPEPSDVADALAVALCHCYLKDKPGKKWEVGSGKREVTTATPHLPPTTYYLPLQ